MELRFKGQLEAVITKPDKPGVESYVFMMKGGGKVKLAGKDVKLDHNVPELMPLEVVADVKPSVLSGLNYLLLNSITCKAIPAL